MIPALLSEQISEMDDLLNDLLAATFSTTSEMNELLKDEPASQQVNQCVLLLRAEVDERLKRLGRTNSMQLQPNAIIRRELMASPLGVCVSELERAITGALMERAMERCKHTPGDAAPSSSLRLSSSMRLSPDPSNRAARKKLDEARVVQAMANDGVGCPFVFLSADVLRDEHAMPRLLPLQEIQRTNPEWLLEETITLDDTCKRSYAESHIAVSHRWDDAHEPDPTGVQLGAIRAHLRERPEVKRVWIDYSCMPQKNEGSEFNTRDNAEKQTFALMLKNINLLFLGIGVLILTDRSYLSRFWTQFEAWLAMQDISTSGLVSAHVADKRCTIRCVHGAPEALVESLVEEWSGCTAQRAFEKLSAPDVYVTNQSDKDLQLPKILELDGHVSVVAQRLGIVPWANSSLDPPNVVRGLTL